MAKPPAIRHLSAEERVATHILGYHLAPKKKNDIPRHHHPGAFGRDRDQQPDKYPEPKTSQTTEPLSIPHYLSPVSTQPKASPTEKRNVTDRKLSLTNSCPEGTTPRLKHTEECPQEQQRCAGRKRKVSFDFLMRLLMGRGLTDSLNRVGMRPAGFDRCRRDVRGLFRFKHICSLSVI